MQPRDGVNYPSDGASSPLMIRHAFVLGPSPDEAPLAEGSAAAVYLSVVNQANRADELTSASSPDAEVSIAPAGENTAAAKDAGAAKSTAVEIPAAAQGQPAADPVQFGQPPNGENTITLTNLERPLRIGAEVRVTLQFERAGQISLELPVQPRAAHRTALSPAPTESPSPTNTGANSDERDAEGTATPTQEETGTADATTSPQGE